MKEGWEIKKLGEVCETSSGGTPSKSHSEYYEGGNIPWLRSGEISQGYIYETELYITEEGLKKSSAKIFPKDTVVIAMYGATVGQVGVLKKEMSTNQAVCGIFPTLTLSPLFLVYYLKAKKAYFLSLAAGGAQPNISQNIIKNTPIPIPPLVEQKKIVEELDCLSGIIEKKKQQLKEYDALAQSIFYEMFGNPIDNEKGWDTEPLKESVIEMFLGPFGSALKTECYVEKNDSFCMVYEQKHAIKKTLELENHYISREKFDELKRFEVHSGDFIMSCRGTIGEIYRLPNDAPIGIIHPSLMKIRIKEDRYNCIFFIRLLSCIIKNENTNGNCVQMAITAKELEARKPILPPLSLQQEFASKIEAIEKQKELIKQSITETEELFNSRMDYYFN